MLMAEMGANSKLDNVLVEFIGVCKYAWQHFSVHIIPEKNSIQNM